MTEARERVPLEPGYFTLPDQRGDGRPRLLGSRCTACDEVFFPRRAVCARCLHRGLRDVELGPRGRLYAHTYVHVPMFGQLEAPAEGYGVGQIDLPEGPRVQSVLLGGPGDFETGMELELDLEVLRTDDQGREVVIYRFRPVAGAAA